MRHGHRCPLERKSLDFRSDQEAANVKHAVLRLDRNVPHLLVTGFGRWRWLICGTLLFRQTKNSKKDAQSKFPKALDRSMMMLHTAMIWCCDVSAAPPIHFLFLSVCDDRAVRPTRAMGTCGGGGCGAFSSHTLCKKISVTQLPVVMCQFKRRERK